jgi:hypothetical protein
VAFLFDSAVFADIEPRAKSPNASLGSCNFEIAEDDVIILPNIGTLFIRGQLELLNLNN